MKEAFIKICRQLLAISLMGIVLLFTVSKSVYSHSHILDDGTVITHAHPYDRGGDNKPFKSHHHNSFELLLFNTFSFVSSSIFVFSSTILQKFNLIFFPTTEVSYYSVYWGYFSGRAPPMIIL